MTIIASRCRDLTNMFLNASNNWSTIWNWSRLHLDQEKQHLILQAMIRDATRLTCFNWQPHRRFSGVQKGVKLLMLPFEYPFVLKERIFWRALGKSVPVGGA